MISRHDLQHKFPKVRDFRHGAKRRENVAFGNDAFGNTLFVMKETMSVTWIISIIIL